MTDRVRELERERDQALNALGDAARELPQCGGTVAHRIEVYRQSYEERIAAAALAMRERCAQACDELASVEGIAQRCAAAIRAIEP